MRINLVYWKPLSILETCVVQLVPPISNGSYGEDLLVSTLKSKLSIVTVLEMSTLLPRLIVGVLLVIES